MTYIIGTKNIFKLFNINYKTSILFLFYFLLLGFCEENTEIFSLFLLLTLQIYENKK